MRIGKTSSVNSSPRIGFVYQMISLFFWIVPTTSLNPNKQGPSCKCSFNINWDWKNEVTSEYLQWANELLKARNANLLLPATVNPLSLQGEMSRVLSPLSLGKWALSIFPLKDLREFLSRYPCLIVTTRLLYSKWRI